MAHIATNQVVTIHQAMADQTRIGILRLLLDRALYVCEIVDILEEPQYKVSRHLAVLRNAGLICDQREGTWTRYTVNPALPVEWHGALQALRQVWDQVPEIQAALWRLQHHTPCCGKTVRSSHCC